MMGMAARSGYSRFGVYRVSRSRQSGSIPHDFGRQRVCISVILGRSPTPSLVNPGKYRLSQFNPGVGLALGKIQKNLAGSADFTTQLMISTREQTADC
jgi:hypothetical protein